MSCSRDEAVTVPNNQRGNKLVDFFRNRRAPFDNPLIADNTRKYAHYELTRAELLQCVARSGSRVDKKRAAQMDIVSVDFYIIPKVRLILTTG